MHDIRTVIDDPAAFDAGLARRGLAPMAATLVALDADRRRAIAAVQDAQTRRNALSRGIGDAKRARDDEKAAGLMAEVAGLKDAMPRLEATERDAIRLLDEALAAIPNIPAPDVPPGADETGNVVLRTRGEPRTFDFAPRDHADLGPPLGLDFDAGVAIAGTRFALLRGPAARLARALGQFMLDHLETNHGYEQVQPPLLVRDEAAFGTGQLPTVADDLFRTTDGRWLIPTAEVPLTNMVRDAVLRDGDLPMRVAALTPCFRSEAGSAGRDTRGLIRQHQFDKVEMVSVTTPELSDREQERMTEAAEGVLEALGLPWRRMLLCAGDMGFTARRTFDLEVWLPGQGAYREISSVSTCGDFQARRMNARFRDAEGRTRTLHTLNGSALAVGRTLVAVLENHQRADGSVEVPAALRPYMRGMDVLRPR